MYCKVTSSVYIRKYNVYETLDEEPLSEYLRNRLIISHTKGVVAENYILYVHDTKSEYAVHFHFHKRIPNHNEHGCLFLTQGITNPINTDCSYQHYYFII